MKRIGIAASKMAKGNLALYNIYVVLISFLFSFFLFLVCGASIFIALIVIMLLINGLVPFEWEERWVSVVTLCMVTLTVVVGIFNLLAMLTNIKLRWKFKDNEWEDIGPSI